MIVVGSAGNTAGSVLTPANCPGVLTVAGIDQNAAYYAQSSFGSEVDVANFATRIPASTIGGGFVYTDGTSPAAAFTSGELRCCGRGTRATRPAPS